VSAHHHSLRPRTRCAAAAEKRSADGPKAEQARSIASVTSSGAWRATYSRSASLNNWLLDFLARSAKRSAAWNRSSGMDTAVFIPTSMTVF